MRALLIKDLLVQKFNVILGGFYGLLLFAILGMVRDYEGAGFIYALSGIAVGWMIVLGSIGGDKGDTARFTLSLPVTRVQAVNGKFLLLLLATVYGTAAVAFFGYVLSIPAIGWVRFAITGVDLLRVAAGMLIPTFLLPFYFRFGHQMIRYFMVAAIGLGVLLQVVGMVVLAFRGNDQRSIAIFEWIMGVVRNGTPVRNNVILIAIGAGICAISYLVSLLIYTRRDL